MTARRGGRGTGRAGAKLAALLLLGIAAFWVTDVAWLAGALAGVVAAAALGGVRPATLARQSRAVLPVVAAVLVAHWLLSGWEHAVLVASRVVLLVAAASAVTLSTPVSDLLAVIASVCRPLRRFGVDPARVGLVLAMAIRFVPLLGERLATIREAQRARGVERPGMTVLPPLLVGTLRLAEDLADALDARGLGDGPA
jgi:biotin transport system permease protein